MPSYDVLRRHEGDKLYDEGDTREISDVDAAHLVRLGVLRKAGQQPQTKVEKATPEARDAKPTKKKSG